MGRFNKRTADDILRQMLENTRGDVDKRQGSVAWDMEAPVAHEIEMLGWDMEATYLDGFLDTAAGEALDMHAHEVGYERHPAVKAVGIANVEGQDGVVIPQGYRFYSVAGIEFTSDSNVVITDGAASVPLTASVGGESGNVGIGELTDHERNIAGITSVTNNDIFIGGVDAESDDSLRERTLFKLRKPITSGNAYHYRLWSREVEGVADAKVFPTWDGPNTVKVVLIASDGGAPDTTIVDAAIDHIENERPIGANVTVLPIGELPIDINVKLTLDGDLTGDDVLDEIKAKLAAYFLDAADGGLIRYTRVGDALLNVRGVLDYEQLAINGGTANVQLTAEQVAIVGEVTLL